MPKNKDVEEKIEDKIKMYLGCYPPELSIRMTIDEHWTCMPTSKLRQAMRQIAQQSVEETIKEFLNGERCHMCGGKMKPSRATNTCPKCWEEE